MLMPLNINANYYSKFSIRWKDNMISFLIQCPIHSSSGFFHSLKSSRFCLHAWTDHKKPVSTMKLKGHLGSVLYDKHKIKYQLTTFHENKEKPKPLTWGPYIYFLQCTELYDINLARRGPFPRPAGDLFHVKGLIYLRYLLRNISLTMSDEL